MKYRADILAVDGKLEIYVSSGFRPARDSVKTVEFDFDSEDISKASGHVTGTVNAKTGIKPVDIEMSSIRNAMSLYYRREDEKAIRDSIGFCDECSVLFVGEKVPVQYGNYFEYILNCWVEQTHKIEPERRPKTEMYDFVLFVGGEEDMFLRLSQLPGREKRRIGIVDTGKSISREYLEVDESRWVLSFGGIAVFYKPDLYDLEKIFLPKRWERLNYFQHV